MEVQLKIPLLLLLLLLHLRSDCLFVSIFNTNMKCGYCESRQVNGLVIKVGISRNSILIAGADAFGIPMFIILVSIQMTMIIQLLRIENFFLVQRKLNYLLLRTTAWLQPIVKTIL